MGRYFRRNGLTFDAEHAIISGVETRKEQTMNTNTPTVELGNMLYAYGELQDNGHYSLLDYYNTSGKANNAVKRTTENTRRIGAKRAFAAFMYDRDTRSWVQLKPPQRFRVSVKVDGRIDVEVVASCAAEAFEKAERKWETDDFDLNKMEIVDSCMVNAEDSDGNLTDYE